MSHRPGNIFRAFLLAGLILLAIGVAPASAATAGKAASCWKKLINDWYDGRIDGTYPIHCYRDALKHLPTDVETYSSARDDIKQALQERITQSSQKATKGQTTAGGGKSTSGGSGGGPGSSGDSGSSGGAGGGSAGGGAGSSGGTGSGPPGGGKTAGGKSGGGKAGSGGAAPAGQQSGADRSAGGPIADVFDAGRPSSADSVPIPLIVLGAVAVLLMVAGAAGFAARRIRLRKLELASAASLPRRPEQPPTDQQ